MVSPLLMAWAGSRAGNGDESRNVFAATYVLDQRERGGGDAGGPEWKTQMYRCRGRISWNSDGGRTQMVVESLPEEIVVLKMLLRSKGEDLNQLTLGRVHSTSPRQTVLVSGVSDCWFKRLRPLDKGG